MHSIKPKHKSKVFSANSAPSEPKIVFVGAGNVSGDITAYPGGVELTKDGSISIQSSNNTVANCNVSYIISVFKG